MITRSRRVKILNPTPRKLAEIAEAVATLTIRHNDIPVGTQPSLNFVDNDSVTFTVTNDNGDQTVNVEANAATQGVGVTLNDEVIGGVKRYIEADETLDIPEYWEYNMVESLDVDGVVDNDGEINFV